MVATPYTINGIVGYVDKNGEFIAAVPKTLRMSASDVDQAKVTFTDYDSDKSWTVPPGPPGAIGVRFREFKASADGADTHGLSLVIGRAESDLVVTPKQASDATTGPASRMQGLDSIVFGIGQRMAFKQLT